MRQQSLFLLTVALWLQTVSAAPADVVTAWNEAAAQAASEAKFSTNQVSRALAMVQIAVNDASVAITRANAAYHAKIESSGPASVEAAAAQAAHNVLVVCLPRASLRIREGP